MGNRTVCTVCGRTVGVAVNWEKDPTDQLVGGYRVSRHAADPRGPRPRERRPMCPGGGIVITAEQLMVGSAPPGR